MRSFLVHADEGPAFETRLQTALDLARATGGHVSLHINTPVARYVAMDPFGGAYPMTEAIAGVRAAATTLGTQLSERLSKDDVPFDVEQSEAEPGHALINAARFADLVVMSLEAPDMPDRTDTASLIGMLAVSAGPPVLAVKPNEIFSPEGPALVAWNDSAESASALRSAVPLLRRATSVRLLAIPDRSGATCDTGAALRYLSRHDVHAEQLVRERGLATVEETIETVAEELGAAFVVMGAYGHSRMRELLFGGVTRYMIDRAKFALLMNH